MVAGIHVQQVIAACINIIFVNTAERIYMLYAYAKNEAEDLTRDQLKALRKIVERW